jgi:hypothetical protein
MCSVDAEDAWLTRLSTLRSPFALLNILVESAVAVLGDDTFANSRLEGTAAFPMVVRNASRGVAILRRPATWVNFCIARTRAR